MDPTTIFKSLAVIDSVPVPSSPRARDRDDSISIHAALPEKPKKAFSRTNSASNVPTHPFSAQQDEGNKVEAQFAGRATIPVDIESGPPTPQDEEAIEVVQTVWKPYMNRWRMAAVCSMIFTDGLHDSCAGALIPYMELDYGVGYATVSLIFVGAALGFVLAAFLLDPLRHKLGRARTLSLSTIAQGIGFLAVSLQPPFPVVAVGYAFVGVGIAINVAFSNLFCGSLANGTTLLGIMHGSYGIGGTVGPLMATAMAGSGLNWSRYYFIGLGMSLINFVLATWSFWGADDDSSTGALVGQTDEKDESKVAGLLVALRSKVVILGSLFIFAYQGAEVSISGWVVSFLINVRGGDPGSAGYVTSGFWAGITLGRFLLGNPAQRVGERLFVYIVTAGAVVFELLVWLVPNLIGNAVAVAIVGILLGPVAPCSSAVFMRTMGRKERVSGLGIMSAFGSSGGAVAPFTTGLLAQAKGTWVMHPVVVGLFVAMITCWVALPRLGKRKE